MLYLTAMITIQRYAEQHCTDAIDTIVTKINHKLNATVKSQGSSTSPDVESMNTCD